MVRTIRNEMLPRPPFDFEAFSHWRDLNKPLIVEIGCGVGFHPLQLAKTTPNSQILAIERTHEKFARFKSRLQHHAHIQNIFPAQADAALLLPHLVPNSRCVDEYFILYPNPYPKPKHRNLRFAYSSLTQFIAQTLKTTGRLTIATNIASYANELIQIIPESYSLELETHLAFSKSTPPESLAKMFLFFPRSHFEKKYFERNEVSHNLTFKVKE